MHQPTGDLDTSETCSTSSSESDSDNKPDDSPDLYRRFESDVKEYVTINPTRGSAEHERLRVEMDAASQPSVTRWNIMERLLSSPEDYTAVSLVDGDSSALHQAALLGSAVICEVLLSSGRFVDINRKNRDDETPLLHACMSWSLTPTEKIFSDRAGVVRHLISYGADIHAKDTKGCTALQHAFSSGNHECAKILLQAGCSISDLKDAGLGRVVNRMIQDRAKDTSKYLDMLKKRRGKSRRPGPQSPIQVTINLLGDLNAGKSSVAASLEQRRPIRMAMQDRTVGASLKRIHAHGMDFLVCDFGGHGSYSFLNHLLLPQFGIYAVFIKVGRAFDPVDVSLQLNRWMYFLSSKIKAPRVLVVLSKVDLLSCEELQDAVDSLRIQLQMMETEEHEAVDEWLTRNESFLLSLQVDGKKPPGCDTIRNNLKDGHAVKELLPKILGDVLCVSCEQGKEQGLNEFLMRCADTVNEEDDQNVDGSRSFFRLSDFPESWEVFIEELFKCRGNGQLALPMSKVRQMAAEAGVAEEDVDICLYLFEAMGHIVHYEYSQTEQHQYVFHDPQNLAESIGHLVHHDLKHHFEVYVTCLRNMSESDDLRRKFLNGLVPLDFIEMQLNAKYRSEGVQFAEAVVDLAIHIGVYIVVPNVLPQGRKMVFVPSLVTRCRSDVDLSEKWGPAQMDGWGDFVMELRLHKGLPIGFVERVLVEVALFTTKHVNFRNGFFAEGWNRCLILLEEESQSSKDKFCRLRFKIRTESSNRDAAVRNMTWIYYVLQTVLTCYPGVLGDVLTPCNGCDDHSYVVRECLNQPYEVLKSMQCDVCTSAMSRSAADVFPIIQTDVDPSTVYFSKFNPKDIGQFANAFGRKATQDEVASITSYLSDSSELLFGVIVLSADELFEYAEGKRRGGHLIFRLKDIGVLTKMSDGCYNYNGLARILFAVGLGLLCDQLLVKQPRSLFHKKGVFEENKSEQDRHKPVHTPGQTGSKDSPGDNSTSFHAGPPTAKTTMSQKEPADAVHAASASAVSQLQAAGTKPTTTGLTSPQTQESSRPTGVFTTQRQSQRIEEQSVKTDDRYKPGHTPGQTGSKDVPGDNPITASSPPGKTTTSQKESAEAGHTASAAAVSQSKAAGTKPTTATLTSPQAQESGDANISTSNSEVREETADGGHQAILRDIKDQLPKDSELFRKLQETISNDAPLKYHLPLNIFGKSKDRTAFMQALTKDQEFSQIPSRSAGIPCFCSSTKDGAKIFFHVYNFSDDDISCGFHRLFMWERAVNVIVIEAKDDSAEFSVMNCRNQLVSSFDDVTDKVPGAVFLLCLSNWRLLSDEEFNEAVADLQDEASEAVSDFNRSTVYHTNQDEENIEAPNKRDGTTGKPIIHEGMIKLAMGGNGQLDSSGLHRFIEILVGDNDENLRCNSNSWDKLLNALLATRDDHPAKLCLTLDEVRQKAHENERRDEDAFQRCLLLLKTGGFLLHFKDGYIGEILGGFVFHDIPFLIDFLRSLFTDDDVKWKRYCRGKKLRTDRRELAEFKNVGLVPEEYLLRLLKNKPEASCESIRDAILLVSRYVGKCSKTNKKTSHNGLPLLFVPSFIGRSADEQADLSEWGSLCDERPSKFTLHLFLERRAMPAGLFWKVVVGIVSNDFKLISVWKSGLVAEGVRFPFRLRTDISPSIDDSSVSLIFELRSPEHCFGDARQDIVRFYKAFKSTMALYYPSIGYKGRVLCEGCERECFDVDELLRQTDGKPRRYTRCECGKLTLLCNDGGKCGIYVAKNRSESIADFAWRVKQTVAQKNVNALAEYLCMAGSTLFGRVIITEVCERRLTAFCSMVRPLKKHHVGVHQQPLVSWERLRKASGTKDRIEAQRGLIPAGPMEKFVRPLGSGEVPPHHNSQHLDAQTVANNLQPTRTRIMFESWQWISVM